MNWRQICDIWNFLSYGYNLICFFSETNQRCINPIGIFFNYLVLFRGGVNFIFKSSATKMEYEMIFVVFGSSAMVFLSGYLFLPRIYKASSVEQFEITNAFILLTRVIFVVSLLCVLIEWRASGYLLPGLDFSSTSQDKKSLIQGIPFIHYGSILMPFCGIYSFFELIYSKKNKPYNYMVLFVSIVFYAFLFTVSRGTFITMILSFVFIYNFKKTISFKKLFLLTLFFLGIFIGITLVRIPKGSMVYSILGNNNILYEYISPIYSYIAFNFENLFKLILLNEHYNFFHYSLLPIWDILGFRESLNIQIYDTEFFNARTYLYSFYHDLGIFGALFFPFLIGCVLSVLYKKMVSDSRYVLLLAVLQKAIFVTFFGNYFFSELVVIWPYFITALLVLSLKYTIKIK